jgi:secreted PhoX family phosphatase
MRDCLFDEAGAETHLFWQASRLTENGLPGSATADVSDPASYASHRQRTFPSSGAGLAKTPDRITLAVHVQAVGDDVLRELVASRDLDELIPPRVARFDLASAALEWTTATAMPPPVAPGGLPKLCVTSGVYNAMVTPAESHARCAP